MGVPARDFEDDGDLVRAVQGGQVDAYSELFRRHYPSVRRACARRLRDPGEADEVAQAAFVRALERIGQCRGDRRFGAWVHVIARSLCADHLRARARVFPSEAPLSANHSDGARPEDPLLEREQRDQVHRAIADLPERQRRAVTARALGLRPGEIAATLGLSIGAVDSLLLRARRRLAMKYTSVASEGGAAAATTGTSTTASLGGVLAVDPAQFTDGMAAAASQVASTVGSLPGVRPAGGVVSAVVTAALSLGGSGAPPPPPVERVPQAAVAVVEPSDHAPPEPRATGAVVIVERSDPAGATVTVTLPSTAGAGTPRVPAEVTTIVDGASAGAAPVVAQEPAAGDSVDLAPPLPAVPSVDDVVGSLPDLTGSPVVPSPPDAPEAAPPVDVAPDRGRVAPDRPRDGDDTVAARLPEPAPRQPLS